MRGRRYDIREAFAIANRRADAVWQHFDRLIQRHPPALGILPLR